MKSNKKAFTIVELVIVIAVIAILAAVLIPTFSNIIKKAQKSSDTQLIRNLNNTLAIDLAEKEENQHSTCFDAMQAVDEAGYNVAKIVSKSGYNIAWEMTSGHFVLLDEQKGEVLYPVNVDTNLEYTINKETEGKNYFVVRYNVSGDDYVAPEHYSLYAGLTFNAKNITLNGVGFDAGEQESIQIVKYVNNSSTAKDVVIRTNTFGTKVVIDGKSGADGDNVTHYGFAAIVDVVNVATASYDECGTVGRLKITNGHIEVMKGGEVFCLMEVGGSNTTATTINEGGIVHDNKENINAGTGITKDDEGVANGLVDDCGPGKHTFSQFVDDDNNTYDVCTCCGYCLVHVKDASGNEIKQTLNKLVEGENGRYVVQEVDGVPNDTITPVLDFLTSSTIDEKSLPKDNFETTTHLHDYKYTSNNNGTHKKACECGEGTVNDEHCDSASKDDVCSKCGYIYGDKTYLTFTAKEANSKVIPAFDRYNNSHEWYYSLNGGAWVKGEDFDVITLVNKGDYVKLKGTGCKGSYCSGEENCYSDYYKEEEFTENGTRFDIFDIENISGESDNWSRIINVLISIEVIPENDDIDEHISNITVENDQEYDQIAGHFFMFGKIEASGSVSSLNGWTVDEDNLDEIFYQCKDRGVLTNDDLSKLK